jgi:hypothetical protein
MAKAVASGALAQGRSGFKAAGKSPSTKDAQGGLEDVFGEGPVWVMNGEGERCVFAMDVIRAEEPAGGHHELDAFQYWVEAEGSLKGIF